MKILLVGSKDGFDSASGLGVKRYMYELKRNLETMPDLEIITLERNSSVFALNIEGYNVDIIHVLDAIPIRKRQKGALIYTAHDFHPFKVPELNPYDYKTIKGRLGLYLTLLPGYRSMLSSDALICNSTQTKEEATGMGFNKNIFVAPLGVDERFIKQPLGKAKTTKFKVGFIGALSTTKNVKFGINAMHTPTLIDMHEIELEIWGLKQEAYKEAKELASLDTRIRFMGFAPEEILVNIYDSFDAFIHPTLYEGFGLPILEAQARGLPVIIYKYGKIPKEVRKYCFEAESPEHMAQIIEHLKENGYNEKERKKAMEYARSFTWERTAKETLKAYRYALGD